jgi:HK97 family phage major capsid protein
MNILEMKDKRATLLDENKGAITSAKAEMRKLNDAEQRAFASNLDEIKALDEKIAQAEKDMKSEKRSVNIIIKKEMNKDKFSLLRAIRNRAEGRGFTDADMAVIEAGKNESRHAGVSSQGEIVLPVEYRADILAGTDTQGSEVVATDKLGILAPLRENLVMAKAGAEIITGLVGDVSIPVYAKAQAGWATEVGASTDVGAGFTDVALSPLRLTAYMDISKRFLIQDSASAEALLKKEIVRAIAGKLEATFWGTTAAVAGTNPGGFFASGYTSVIDGAVAWGDIIDMEAAVDANDALMGSLAYVTNAAGRGILKQLPKESGQAMYMMDPDGTMNGYPVHVSNHIPSLVTDTEQGIVFGNFGDYVLGQWGAAADILVDPYTQASTGQVRLVINSYFDAKPRRSASFALGSFKAA